MGTANSAAVFISNPLTDGSTPPITFCGVCQVPSGVLLLFFLRERRGFSDFQSAVNRTTDENDETTTVALFSFHWLNLVGCRTGTIIGRKGATLLAGSFVCAPEVAEIKWILLLSINILELCSLVWWAKLKEWLFSFFPSPSRSIGYFPVILSVSLLLCFELSWVFNTEALRDNMLLSWLYSKPRE